MKLIVVLILTTILQASAVSFAQTISIHEKQVPLKTILQKIRLQSGYGFFYNKDVISAFDKVSLNVTNGTIEEALQQCLENKPLSFTIKDKNVIIKLKTEVFSENQDRKKGMEISSHLKIIPVIGRILSPDGQPLANVSVKIKGSKVGTATDKNGSFSLQANEGDVLEVTSVGYTSLMLMIREGKLLAANVPGSSTKNQDNSDQILNANSSSLLVKLKKSVGQLDEVMVVAYGTTTNRVLTGSISTVKAEEFKDIPATNIGALLQGRVAGLDITNMSGAPGGSSSAIVIRGYNSLDVEQGRRFSAPLWVVDGVPLNSFASPVSQTNMLADLNPDMIESVQVLKDASAAALYGSRAANGVIVVTTKKGKKGQKASFAANGSTTWSFLPQYPSVTTGRAEGNLRLWQARNTIKALAFGDTGKNASKYPGSYDEQYQSGNTGVFDPNFIIWDDGDERNGSIYQDSLNTFYNNSTNFFPVYFVKGKVTNANIQSYGGGESISYGTGLGYYNEEGIFRGTGYQRVDLNTSLNVQPVKRLNIDFRMNASVANRKRGSKLNGLTLSPDVTVPSIEVVPGDPLTQSTLFPGEGSDVWNTILSKYEGIKETNRNIRLRSNVKVGYEIINGLTFSTSLAGDYAVDRRNYFSPSYLSKDHYSMSLGETGINLMVLNENLLSYEKKINNHHISFLAGFSYQYDQNEYNGGSAKNSPSDKIYYAPPTLPGHDVQTSTGGTVNYIDLKSYISDMQEKALISYFGRLEYNFKEKYLFSVSMRRDGSSTFGQNNRWGIFPSVATGWTFSEESFIKDNVKALSFGKIRASWGRSGMHFSQNYLALGSVVTGSPYLGHSTIEPVWTNGLYNDKLSWEETDQYDLGIDMAFFDNRLGITSDYYYRYTDKMLNTIKLPGIHNGYSSQYHNAGAISNEGLELMVKYDVIRRKNLYWKVSINASRNWNRFEQSADGRDNGTNVIGEPLNGIKAFKVNGYVTDASQLPIYYDANGRGTYLYASSKQLPYNKPGDYLYGDLNSDGKLEQGPDIYYVGSALPQVSGGIVSELTWKNFSLNVSCSFQLGRYMSNQAEVLSLKQTSAPQVVLGDLSQIKFWEKPGDAGYSKYLHMDPFAQWSDLLVEKVNYLKLRTVTLGYNLPDSWCSRIGVKQVRVFTTGENLATWTNYSGFDPEAVPITSGMEQLNTYPLPRKITLGLTFKF